MKKLYTTPDFREYHKRKLRKLDRKNRIKRKLNTQEKRDRDNQRKLFYNYRKNKNEPLPLYAPKDFRLIDNPTYCLNFFRDVRSHENIFYHNKQKQVIISLVDVQLIDYATISALIAISDDLKSKKIVLRGDFPVNPDCKKYIIESGFLTHMVDERNRQFAKQSKSKFIFFEKGCGKLSRKESKNISELIKDVVEYLTGEKKNIKPLKTILLEICGNSIEHAKTKDKQWLLGVKYENKKVIFTVTDVGKGILETLYINNVALMGNLIKMKSKLEILKGAFTQRYGSSTQEENRNKGLPAIKVNSDFGTIKNLIVLTNNVILHFENDVRSSTFSPGTPRFKGTMYQWELTEDCIINTINYYVEN